MPWPALTDFSEAIQNPKQCFGGTDLEDVKVATNRRGLPLVFSGSFACVYSVSSHGRSFAVRCFTREVRNQQSKYNKISDYLVSVLPPSFVHFQYVVQGIRVRGSWYPIVKMEWVEGNLLNKFVESSLSDSAALRRLAAQWRGGAMASLRGLRIAHNDLQHGNVMVQGDGTIRLVDYDGLFLPQFQGENSPELGHKHYQHPKRTHQDYGDYVDNFPSIVIYLSLLAIATDPGLWSFNNDDNLVFTMSDFADPGSSELFGRLKGSSDPAVAQLSERLEDCCRLPVNRVPDLETILSDIPASHAPVRPALTPVPPRPTLGNAPGAPPTSGGGFRQVLRRRQETSAKSPPARPIPRPPLILSQSTAWYADKPWMKWFFYSFGLMLLVWFLQTELVTVLVNSLLIIAGVVVAVVFLATKNPGYLILGVLAIAAGSLNFYGRLVDFLWPWVGILAAATIVFFGSMDILNSRKRIRRIAVGLGILVAVLCAVAFVVA